MVHTQRFALSLATGFSYRSGMPQSSELQIRTVCLTRPRDCLLFAALLGQGLKRLPELVVNSTSRASTLRPNPVE